MVKFSIFWSFFVNAERFSRAVVMVVGVGDKFPSSAQLELVKMSESDGFCLKKDEFSLF